MKTRYFNRTVLASAVLGMAAALGAAGTAGAAPTLQIIGGSQEAIGDAGGTTYPVSNNVGTSGAGLPTAAAGWPNTLTTPAGFAPDSSIGGARGISGYVLSYLSLTEAATVRFQFMGEGNASNNNSFWVDQNQNGIYETNNSNGFNENLFNGNATNACGAAGSAVPVISCTAGYNQFDIALSAGLVKFRYDINQGSTYLTNNVAGGNEQPAVAGYFLGVDPYLASGTFERSGTVVYAGLTDGPFTPGAGGADHDFQDMGVRISVVPEPGGLALVMAAFGGLALTQRRGKSS